MPHIIQQPQQPQQPQHPRHRETVRRVLDGAVEFPALRRLRPAVRAPRPLPGHRPRARGTASWNAIACAIVWARPAARPEPGDARLRQEGSHAARLRQPRPARLPRLPAFCPAPSLKTPGAIALIGPRQPHARTHHRRGARGRGALPAHRTAGSPQRVRNPRPNGSRPCNPQPIGRPRAPSAQSAAPNPAARRPWPPICGNTRPPPCVWKRSPLRPASTKYRALRSFTRRLRAHTHAPPCLAAGGGRREGALAIGASCAETPPGAWASPTRLT